MANSHTNNSHEPIRLYIDRRFVKVVSEQLGIASLSEDCCNITAEHVTYSIKTLLEQAKKLAVHCRRAHLTTDDIESAFRIFGQEAILGHDNSRKSVVYKSVADSAEMLDHEVFIAEDAEVDMAAIANSKPPKPPLCPMIRAHWLVYDGEQIYVPQNPIIVPKRIVRLEEHEERFNAIPTSSRRESLTQMSSGASIAYRLAMRSTRKAERIYVKPSSSHQLSLEQQRFFRDVLEACVGLDDKRRVEALESLQMDTGLQSLLPNISRWLAQGVYANIIQRSLAMLIYIVHAHAALLHNRSLDIHPVLHEMVPSLLSCMISRQLCSRPDIDNHWTLRDFASKCLVQLVREHGVCDTQKRVQQALRYCFMNSSSSANMRYGAFHALFDLSASAERAAFYPHFIEILHSVDPNVTASMPNQRRIDSEKLYALLVRYEQAMSKCAAKHHANKSITAMD